MVGPVAILVVLARHYAGTSIGRKNPLMAVIGKVPRTQGSHVSTRCYPRRMGLWRQGSATVRVFVGRKGLCDRERMERWPRLQGSHVSTRFYPRRMGLWRQGLATVRGKKKGGKGGKGERKAKETYWSEYIIKLSSCCMIAMRPSHVKNLGFWDP